VQGEAAKKLKGIFGLLRHYVLQKAPFKTPSKIESFSFRFSPSLWRPEAPAYTEQVVTLAFAHTAHTSHWPLTFVRVACSVRARVRLVTPFKFVALKVVCANAQTSLYPSLGANPSPSGDPFKMVEYEGETLSQNFPHRLRLQVPPRLDHQIPQAGPHRSLRHKSPRPHPRDLRHPSSTNTSRTRLQGSCTPLHLHAAADLGLQDGAVPQRQDGEKDTPREPTAHETLLGQALLEQRILRGNLRRYHRRDDHGVHQESGRGRREARRQLHGPERLTFSFRASARHTCATYEPLAFRRGWFSMCLSHPPDTRTNTRYAGDSLSFLVRDLLDFASQLLCISVRQHSKIRLNCFFFVFLFSNNS